MLNGTTPVPAQHAPRSDHYLNGVRVAASLPNGECQYYLTDQVDSVSVVTDDKASVVNRFEYLPFGEAWDTSGDGLNRPKYCSAELDAETNFYYMNARYQDPGICRFTTPDTVIDGEYSTQGWNRYSYCHNNPVRYKDPSGHAGVADDVAAGALIGAYVGTLSQFAVEVTDKMAKSDGKITLKNFFPKLAQATKETVNDQEAAKRIKNAAIGGAIAGGATAGLSSGLQVLKAGAQISQIVSSAAGNAAGKASEKVMNNIDTGKPATEGVVSEAGKGLAYGAMTGAAWPASKIKAPSTDVKAYKQMGTVVLQETKAGSLKTTAANQIVNKFSEAVRDEATMKTVESATSIPSEISQDKK